MTQRELFQQDAGKVQWLREVIEHPVMQEVISLLATEGTPAKPSPIPNVSYAEMMSVAAAESIGYQRALYSLRRLHILPPKEGQAEMDHYASLALRELEASQLYSKEEIARFKENQKHEDQRQTA